MSQTWISHVTQVKEVQETLRVSGFADVLRFSWDRTFSHIYELVLSQCHQLDHTNITNCVILTSRTLFSEYENCIISVSPSRWLMYVSSAPNSQQDSHRHTHEIMVDWMAPGLNGVRQTRAICIFAESLRHPHAEQYPSVHLNNVHSPASLPCGIDCFFVCLLE